MRRGPMIRPILDEADHQRVSEAVSRAEEHTSGEIVTILAERSDGYGDIALAWAAVAAFAKLAGFTLLPDWPIRVVETISGHWNARWSPAELFTLAGFAATVAFLVVWAIQLWPPLKYALVPRPIKTARVRARAITCFRIGAERRTRGRTGILIYLSLRERRAEIVADEAIASRVSPDVWGDAMDAMLAELHEGRIAEGLIAAIERVGAVLAEHLPRDGEDSNELPDRLIEV